MRKILLVLFITFIISVLQAEPMDEINDWAAKQTQPFDANDVVTFMIGRDDGDITYGSEYVFNSANTQYISVAVLDATHFVVSYRDHGNSYYGTAVIGTLSGNYISYSPEYVFNSANTQHTSVAVLDATHFVVSYRDEGNSGYGTAVIGTVSGNTISYGSEYVFNSWSTNSISVAVLDAAHFVVSYNDYIGTDYGTAVIGTISDNTISFGSEYIFNSATTYYTSVAVFDAAHFVVSYRDVGNANYGTAVIGTVSDNTISYGSEYVFNSVSTDYSSVAVLDETRFVVGYCDGGNSAYGTAVIGTVSGNTISYSSEYVFNSANTSFTSTAVLDAAQFVISYWDGGNSFYGTAVIGTVSGNTISYGSEYVFNSADTQHTSVAVLDAAHFVVSYRDAGTSGYGTAIVGEVEGTCTADFSATPTFGYYPSLDVYYTDQSSGIITNWSWDFQNDGIYDSFIQNPIFTYTDVGIYDVKLKISNETQADSLIKNNYITVEYVPPAPPTDVQIDIVGDNIMLSWTEVDTTIFGDPIDVDYYLVYYSEYPSEDSLFFFHGATIHPMYFHYYAALFADAMFYKVESFVGTRQELDEYIADKPKELFYINKR